MRTHSRHKAAQRAGRTALLIALLAAPARVPDSMAAPGTLDPLPNGDGQRVSCGEPAISYAPAVVICENGGEGASSCETGYVISVGGVGTVSGCGVSCTAGFYACCQNPTLSKHADCSCRPDPARGPWTPETPW